MKAIALSVCITSGICLIGHPSHGDEGLIGHWKLAGDAKDSSGHNNHGTASGTITTVDGPNGQSAGATKFDGLRTMIEVPPSDSLNVGDGDFSLAVWAQ